MSSEVQVWAMSQRCGDPVTKAVLVTLSRWAKPDGSDCWPGIDTIAEAVEVAPRTVQRHLDALEKRGLIRREPRIRTNGSQSSNRYIFTGFEAGCQIVTPPNSQDDNLSPLGGDTAVTPIRPVSQESKTKHVAHADRLTSETTHLPVGMECVDATEFRSRAIRQLGEASYRHLLHRCHIYPQGDELVLRSPSPTLCDLLRHKVELRYIARELGFGLRAIVGEVHHVRDPDPKVADAERQLAAIRDARVARPPAQVGRRR